MARGKIHVPPLDSPSKQLMRDLAQQFEQVRLFDLDLKRVHAYERKSFHDELDRKEQELAAQHNAALDEAAAYHDRVREEAEAYLKEHIRKEEEEQRRKEEEARKERERVQREKAEKLRRKQEEKARIEAERQAKEEANKKAEREAEQARRAAQAEKESQERRERERVESEKRKQEEETQKARQEAEQRARSEQQAKVGGARLTEAEIKVQERYVELHKTLKQMRQWLRNVAKENAPAKQAMGDMRRSIKKCVGQLRDGKGANRQQIAQIKAELEKASSISEPSVDVRKFIAFPPPEIANSEDNKAPALLIYGLNIFAKALISALINEASINPGHAEPVGIVAAQIFSMDAFMYKGIHMSDILWAKYRVFCPALWGFTGDEKTNAGRRALGWWRDEAGGPFVSDQTHADRMTALGAGYAALALRNFGKTQRRNPFPNTMFWTSLTKILAIPPGEMQETQVTLLGSMLRSSGERILGFFGQFGLLLMRRAIVDLPEVLPHKTMGVNQLKLLRELYQREKNIDL